MARGTVLAARTDRESITAAVGLGSRPAALARLPDGFHATEDRQAIRDRVLDLLHRPSSIRVSCTHYSRARVYFDIQQSSDYFYRPAWFYHLRHVVPRIVPRYGELLIGVTTIATKKKRWLHAEALRQVVRQCVGRLRNHCAHWSAPSHPWLQADDYYT